MFEKVYRIGVLLLLALILGVQVFTQFRPAPGVNADCTQAIENAATTAEKAQAVFEKSLDTYDNDVYKKADNINQQQFMALEHIYVIQTNLVQLQLASLNVQRQCR